MSLRIAIIGAGDLGQQIAHYIKTDRVDTVVGYFDDTKEKGAVVSGAVIFGGTNHIRKAYEEGNFDALLIGIGYKHLNFKKTMFDTYTDIPFAHFIHSSVVLDPTAVVEQGAVIFPGCILDKNAHIGANVLLNIGCSVSHDSTIGAHSFLSPRVAIAGFTTVGTACILGINSTVIDNVKIGDGVRLGAGAVAVNNLSVPGTYIGIPGETEGKCMIPFNKPYLTGKETSYIAKAVATGKISGNGDYTQLCQNFFETNYGFKKTLLTTSCTDALEMAAILIDCKQGDEVIMPSYTFVSTAIAFIREGVKVVFCDSNKEHPNIDASQIKNLITPNTKAIVVVHYAGVAVDMDPIMELATQHNLYVIEDAAQAIDACYKDRPLGGIGDLAAFSFHETKNVISGEGGMLVINDEQFVDRSEIIWEKGTNRASFFRGEINKYGWVDIGSSFLPSEIIAAFLYAQLENLKGIQQRRLEIWNRYFTALVPLQEKGKLQLPIIPEYATNNAHMFYVVCNSLEERSALIAHLKAKDAHAVFHYISLHKSDFYLKENPLVDLPLSDKFTNQLLRLPMFYELSLEHQQLIINLILEFYSE